MEKEKTIWFKLPFEEVIYEVKGQNNLHASNKFILHNFEGDNEISVDIAKAKKSSITNFDTNLTKWHLPKPPSIPKDDYQNWVEKAKISILKTNLNKVVLARQKMVDCLKSPLEVFKDICVAYDNCFVHLVYVPNQICSVGASPELLLSYKQLALKSVSMAGTLSPNKQQFSKKEKEEQAWVTNYITQIFKENGIEPNILPEVISNGHLQHLHTTILKENIALTKEQLDKIVAQLHPTPAICGVPMIAAKNQIKELESFNRSLYSGYLGIAKPNERHLFVNLRCALLYEHKAILYAGAGITKDSIAALEYQETESKMDVVGRFLR